MLKLISLAMHFSPHTQGALDPIVIEMLRRELSPTIPTTPKADDLQTDTEETKVSEAA